MNSKLLVFVLFAVWSGISWRWYVCGVKKACSSDREVPGTGIVADPGGIETDTITAEQIIQPSDGYTGGAGEPSSIETVHMEALEDRMVIHFPYSSTRKEDNEAIDDYLSRLAQYMIASGEHVTISGHTDFVSDPKTNYQYGLRRAYGIRDILIKKGVPKSQIRCRSYGESKPVASNDTALGRYKNRRAEIVLNKK
ncbi:MAG: OmpA family protein [Saprospiraceae bacterium]|nr:OmpA family protein [Saprospiraceae bacterium]MCB0574762.1 OmpA family protein [Saprospiraceae bacterium]